MSKPNPHRSSMGQTFSLKVYHHHLIKCEISRSRWNIFAFLISVIYVSL